MLTVPLQPPDRERVRGQAQVGLGLAAAGREEQQVDLVAVLVPRVGERGQVEQHERELERAPGGDLPAVVLDLGLRLRVAVPFSRSAAIVVCWRCRSIARFAKRNASSASLMALRSRVGHKVDARLDPLRALARGEDRGLGGRLERVAAGQATFAACSSSHAV